MTNQEILSPARDLNASSSRREIEMIDNSVETLKGKLNLLDRIRLSMKSGQAVGEAVAEMQRDVLQAQRDIVQHHAQMIARERKMQLTDAYQAGIAELTRRVEDRMSKETEYYWGKIYDRLDYYENFFQTKINGYRAQAEAGEMPQDRAQSRIRQCEADREAQLSHDHVLLDELRDANARVLKRALEDYRPT